jgi:two-component sensor histidine kinase
MKVFIKKKTMIKLIFFIVLFWLSGMPYGYAQKKCDCAVAMNLRPKIAGYFNSGKLDSAELIIRSFGNENTLECNNAFYSGLTQIAMSKKQFDKAREYLNKQEGIVLKLNCNAAKVICYNNFVRLFIETTKPDSVIHYGTKVMEMALEEQNLSAYARAAINIGVVFNQQKQHLKSMEYYRMALDAVKKTTDTVIMGAALFRLSESSLKQYNQTQDTSQLEKVLLYGNECIQVSTGRASLMELVGAYNAVGKYFLIKKNYEKVIELSNKTITLCPKGIYNFLLFLSDAYQNKSDVHFAKTNYLQAKQMADSALHYAALQNIQLTIAPLTAIYRSSKAMNDYQNALSSYEKLNFLKDSIFSVEKNKSINELEKKYNQSQNERKINDLAQQKKMYGLFALAGLLLVGLIAFFMRQQSLKHKQKILETEQRLNRARMNPHFFFNALASLQNFAMNDKDSITMAENLSKFSHIMRETLENTYREYVTIEQEMTFLEEYLELQSIRFPNKFSHTIIADKNLEVDDLMIPSMILQPFVENSIEHGFLGIAYTGILALHFSKDDKEIKVTITDNGKGLKYSVKSNAEHISRASQIIKDRIYLLNIKLKTNARFSIDNNTDGEGVNVVIHLPILYKENISLT